MTAQLVTFTNDMSVAANAQTLFGGIDAFLRANGWALTADTGQTDPATMTAPGNNAFTAYRLYTPSDALTAFTVRLDFGREANANRPMIKVQVGTGSNGTGTITGALVSTNGVAFNGSPGSGTLKAYMSSAAGRFFFSFGDWTTTAANTAYFALHRTVDSSGAMDSGGIVYDNYTLTTGTAANGFVPFSGTAPAAMSYLPAPFTSAVTSAVGSSVFVALPIYWSDSAALNPNPLQFVYGSSDFSNATTNATSVYGSSRTYLCAGFRSVNVGGTNQARTALLYD